MKKILVVDDEPSILQVLARALKREDTEVFTASNIDQANDLLDHTQFHTVVTDLQLEDKSDREGLELLRRLERESPSTRVIVITGHGSKSVESDVFDKGGCFYFEKPIDLRILQATI